MTRGNFPTVGAVYDCTSFPTVGAVYDCTDLIWAVIDRYSSERSLQQFRNAVGAGSDLIRAVVDCPYIFNIEGLGHTKEHRLWRAAKVQISSLLIARDFGANELEACIDRQP